MGLAKTGAAVQQQWVVGTVAGLERGLPGSGTTELVAAALDEVVEGVMAVQIALVGLAGPGSGASGRGGRLGIDATQGADVQVDLGITEIGGQFADARQVMAADFLHHEGVGRVQHQLALATVGLQRFQPGADILRREFGFQALQAAGPDIHDRRYSWVEAVDGTTDAMSAACG